MHTSKELRQELGEIITRQRAILDKARDEKRARSADEETEIKRLDTRADELEVEIPRIEKLESREAVLAAPARQPVMRPSVTREDDNADDRTKLEERYEKRFGERGRAVAHMLRGHHSADPTYRRAFTKFFTGPKGTGVSSLTPEEQRSLSAGASAEGGFTIPPEEFLLELLKTVDDQVVIRGPNMARMFEVVQSQSLGVPTLAADPADPDWTNELLTGNEDSTMSFGKRELRPFPLAKRIKVSDKLLRASPLGMESIVRSRLAYKIAIAQSKAFNTGDGVNKPLGIYTPSADGISTNRDSDISTTNEIDPDKLIAARYTLRPGYWPNAKWHLHRLFLARIRKLKTGTSPNQYLWQPGLTVGAPNTLLDFPYVVDEYAPSTQAGSGIYICVLGDFSYYWIVDALNIALRRLDELYAETNQVGFIIRQESDAQPVLEDAFVRCKGTLT
jgi:HK97 family phage major capsid protein